MVATRRGVRVSSPNTVKKEASINTEATPATRRTKRKTTKEETQSQSEVTSDSQHDEGEEGEGSSGSAQAKSSTVKRKPRALRQQKHDEAWPDSTHEADVSESESCCSAVSDLQDVAETQLAHSGRRGPLAQQKPSSKKLQDVPSEAESACSSASASQRSSTRRTTRSRSRSTPAKAENSEAESVSSALSGAGVLTRSQKRIVLSRASSKSRTEDTELSEAGSCSSTLSGLPPSTVRRSTRSRRGKDVQPVPLNLEENAEASPLPRRQTRASRAKPETVCEPQSCDSEGFESGPSNTPRRVTRNRAASKQQLQLVMSDSESEATDVYSPLGSPSSLRGKYTPCSSRTGSGSSVRALSVPMALKALDEQETCETPQKHNEAKVIVTEPAVEAMAVDPQDSPECSLVEEVGEEDKTLIAEEEVEGGVSTVTVTVDENVEPQIVLEASVPPSGSVKVTECGSAETEENKEEDNTMDVEPQGSPDCIVIEESQRSVRVTSEADMNELGSGEEKLQIAEDVEVGPSSVVKVKVSNPPLTEQKEAEEVMALETDSTVLTVCQKSKTESENHGTMPGEDETVSSSFLEKTVARDKPSSDCLLLLESSDEEEDHSHSEGQSQDEKDSEGSDDDEILCTNENQAGPSKPKAKSQSLPNDGLFVIDTKPGLQSDGKYYLDQEQTSEEKEMDGEEGSSLEEDEQDEEFVDEEGEDDDDPDDAILFQRKSKNLIEFSSSIDPGLKVKDIGGLYISVDGSKSKVASNALKKLKEQKNQDEVTNEIDNLLQCTG
ncbi:hypothetical protein JZ751_024763 [Albula glossodonta]|uniref:Deoxynucleotidyltransferase terminal-interacting protein 2 n=1 Tax=Albula glossodonta TaxID=121402 RepID=A0A8T2PEA6_9TELE|nr:hypothetical protein JZ751_024763 [Albula glossodonta]